MQIIKGDRIAYFDVDDTLVLWNYPDSERARAMRIGSGDHIHWVVPHLEHIDQIRRHKARGHTVVIWSAGGWEWALAVVEALNLTGFVDAVMCKPSWYWDDLTCCEILGQRAFKKPGWEKP